MPTSAAEDNIPGIGPAHDEPKSEIPWQEVIVVHFPSLSGRRLGELPLEVLEKMRDRINRQSATVRATKPGIVDLLGAVCKGIKELTPVPAKATPLDGLRNLMQNFGVTEEAVLKMVTENFEVIATVLEELEDGNIRAIIAAWPDAVSQFKENSK